MQNTVNLSTHRHLTILINLVYCFAQFHLLYCLRGEDVLSMDDDGVLTELRRIILVQPVVVLGEVTLLRDPELDGVVLHLDEVQPRRPEHGDEQ